MIKRIAYNVFEVESETDPSKTYTVFYDRFRKRFFCTCPGFVTHLKNGKPCKHILSVLSSIGNEIEL
jgi:hypothetical protein